MTPQDFHLNFSYKDADYSIKLLQDPEKYSNYSVTINGISYKILGEEEKLPMAYNILNSISLTSIGSDKDLSRKIENLTKVAVLPKTIKALSILNPTATINNEIVKGSEGNTIDSYLRSMVEKTSFRGSVMVVKESEIILSKGYGNATLNEKNTASTIFHIGSLTKQFTAAAIMKLVEKGNISLNEKINLYLSQEYQSEEYWKNITIQQLLSHTSGISNYTEDPNYFKNCLSLTKDLLIKEAMKEPLRYPIGEFHYSNTGYLLLGAIIEEQSKVSYREFMSREFFIPADMNESGVHDITFELNPTMAIGFRPDESGDNLIEDVIENLSQTCGADGAIYSSLEDLLKWSQILDKGKKILMIESLNEMKTPIKNGYGYGLGIEQNFGTTKIFHDGLVPGFVSSFVKYPEKDIFIAVLGNNGKFPSGFLTNYISELLLDEKGEGLTIIPHDFREDPRLGIFKSIEGSVLIELFEKNGHLFMKGIDAPGTVSECFLLSNKRILHPSGLQIEFKEDSLIVYAEHEKNENNPEGKVDQLARSLEKII
ncbi:MAG: serine hydrolase [Candidatus Protochlamydia sp.]|nr:serine hydrolase [Candidatus Protochlamydia sp.]